ncbi:MAG: response regulator [Firmicutes bacterium]|nr:response regulator [Bacillota bacterium]
MRSTILCVDDEKVLLNILYEQLEEWFGENYQIERALSGEEALEIIDECIADGRKVSVVISDYIMPNMKGDELLAKIKDRDPRIKKIMLTGYAAIDGIINAINKAGLYRYISKPWDNKDLMLTLLEAIKSYEREMTTVDLMQKYDQLSESYNSLVANIEETTNKITESFAVAADIRGLSSDGHSQRVAQFSAFLGKSAGMDNDRLKRLIQAALLHDVGKIVLSDDQIRQLREYKLQNIGMTQIRKQQIEGSEKILKNLPDYSELEKGIKYQFEEFMGSGPLGIAGEDIPLEARIISIANAFDFLKNKQTENKYSLNEIVDILEDGKDIQYDPKLIDKFIGIIRPKIG